jgi:long-chain acyl-CoA synthetase
LTIELTTILDVFRKIIEINRPAAMRVRSAEGKWIEISGNETCRRSMNVARQLQQWGIQRGDRILLLSENRPEWAIADFACLLAGAVDVPVYPTLTSEQSEYIVRDSGARMAFVSTKAQFQKLLSIADQAPLERIVVFDDLEDTRTFKMSEIMSKGESASPEAIDRKISSAKPDDLATIIYTSGTTGTPKGVMLTHGNIASNIVGSCKAFQWSNGEGYVSFLPLSHITARHVDYIMLAKGISTSYCPTFDEVARTLVEVAPHNFVSVPRLYEKIRQEAERRAGTGLKKEIFDWALRVGRKHRQEILAGKVPSDWRWTLANKLVFRKVQAAMGGRLDCCISGGAPLPVNVAEWFADIGVRIFEGYGLTETSPVIGVNTHTQYRLGSIGRKLPNVEVKIAEDGELLVRGPSVMKGYWKMPEATAEAFVDGWFKTGDIARIDDDGFIFITDRKKDLIKTSGGKFIAPQPIENRLRSNVLVAQAVVIGDKRKYASVLIQPNFPLLEDWAGQNGISFSDRQDLISSGKVLALYESIVNDLNSGLAQFERMKKVILVPDEFSIASGELTPSLKLKRRVVEQKYADVIDEMYAQPHHDHPGALGVQVQ